MVPLLSRIAPFLCALYPFLYLYFQNLYYFSLFEVSQVVLGVISALFIIWRLLLKFEKDRNRALLYIWFVVIALGLFQYISQGIYVVTGSRGGFAAANAVSFAIWVVFIWSLCCWTLRILGDKLRYILDIGSVFAAMLCIVAIANQGFKLATSNAVRSKSDPIIESNPGDHWNKSLVNDLLHQANYPDIYFILTDGLARGDVLKEIYDYDSSPFEAELERQGVYIFKKAHSNYASTLLSLPTMLNYNYLSDVLDPKDTDRGGLISVFNKNRVMENLREYGYGVMAFESAFQGTQGLNSEKIQGSFGYSNSFLLGSSVILSFPPVGDLLTFWQRSLHRSRSKDLLEGIGKLGCNNDKPKFVWGHLLMPHPPFVLDRNGSDVDLGEPSNLDGLRIYNYPIYKHHYSEQARYVHTKLLQAVKEIKEKACRPTYILITADHGPLLKEVKEGAASPDMLRERMSIFSAVYFPDQDYSSLSQDLTPINIVRSALTHTGLANLKPIPDRTFYSTWDAPFKFTEIRVPDKFEKVGQ